ncbi:hypothetical protein H6P81_016594 [Aristolochia fimbriata]|uniref:Uncharacterized protein n=1 Tax=Aristolochia fimbriata TaxID=158543 RepID=A0AAV7EAE6_ARIFI|nr:hypothetical protein H6P81_016594 [Aristolochia fimbriata]
MYIGSSDIVSTVITESEAEEEEAKKFLEGIRVHSLSLAGEMLESLSSHIPKPVNWENHILQGSVHWELQMVVSKLVDERPIWPKRSMLEHMGKKLQLLWQQYVLSEEYERDCAKKGNGGDVHVNLSFREPHLLVKEVEDPLILIHKKKISNMNAAVVLELRQRPSLIVAKDVESDALATLIGFELKSLVRVSAHGKLEIISKGSSPWEIETISKGFSTWEIDSNTKGYRPWQIESITNGIKLLVMGFFTHGI